MDLVKALLAGHITRRGFPHLVWQRFTWERPVALQSSILDRLPLEILEHIATSLPPSSAVAFSLSCMQLARLLGGRHLVDLASNAAETAIFIHLLARDLQDEVGCSACLRLHKIQNVARYVQNRQRRYRACSTSYEDYIVNRFCSSCFSEPVFRMAMKRYQQQREYGYLVDLMSSTSVARMSRRSHYIFQSRAECRIVEGTMVLRSQSVYFFIFCTTPRIPSVRPFAICAHLTLKTNSTCAWIQSSWRASNESFGKIWSIAWDRVSRKKVGRRYKESELLRCPHCPVEFRVDFKWFRGRGAAMVVSRWLNMGTVPDDGESSSFQVREKGPPRKDYRFRVHGSSLATAFEGRKGFNLDDFLSPDNTAALFRAQEEWQWRRKQRRKQRMAPFPESILLIIYFHIWKAYNFLFNSG